MQLIRNDWNCGTAGFEYMMALKSQQIRPFVKKAILNGLTYTDKDGQEKPLAQFYTQKLHWGINIYGLS